MYDRRTIIRLAAEAGVDPRTAEKALEGAPVRGVTGRVLEDIIARWRAEGLLPPVPAEQGSG
jgi:hypothetical protein